MVMKMKQIIIEGKNKLSGTINIGGAKNSAVALIPAAIMADGVVKLSNVPRISDADALTAILKFLNVDVNFEEDKYTIDARNLQNNVIPEDLSTRLRASYYFMGALLARFKHVEIYFPGGCNIGARPIDLHLKGFEALGATVTKDENNSKYIIDAQELTGSDIHLDFASVGATINIMFAATLAKGVTKIYNAAQEVEIINIAELLNNMGANIKGAGTNVITIEGVEHLHSASVSVICDRIEAGTYLIMGALLGDNLKIMGIEPEYLQSLLDKFQKMNIKYDIIPGGIMISQTPSFLSTDVKTDVYPEFPTDLGQPMSVLLTQASGISHFEETIWESRMGHIKYLNMMGANIEVNGMKALIKGTTPLTGKEIVATDLRAGAALVTAGLIASGTTIINDAEHILRGYERIINKLSNVGAKIKIIDC